MTKIRLFLLKGRVASPSTVADAQYLKQIPKEKLADFMKWIVRLRVKHEAYTDKQWDKFCALFDFKSAEEVNGAQRFASLLFTRGADIDRSQIISDLENLDFDKEKIELLINKLEYEWDKHRDYLKGIRLEAIPRLTSLRWRVDIRYSSSSYLKEPEAVALLRLGTTDGTETDMVYMELDKDKLSWLENVVAKIKREFIRAEEKLNEVV